MTQDLGQLAIRIRLTVLDQSKRANVGHIGSALSVADILAALYGKSLRGSPRDRDRDRFVLSKGHAALAMYAAMRTCDQLSDIDLATYCADDSLLGVHPEHAQIGVDFSTGSLGQGLSFGVGAALAARMQSSSRRTFVLLSDAECNEGSVWEAAMFASHHRLGNLTAIVDLNGQQALGYTAEVLDQSRAADRWRSFGWDVHEVDGHDPEGIAEVINGLEGSTPHVLLARTVFGKGVPFMESRIEWHYLPMSSGQYADAIAAVRGNR